MGHDSQPTYSNLGPVDPEYDIGVLDCFHGKKYILYLIQHIKISSLTTYLDSTNCTCIGNITPNLNKYGSTILLLIKKF